MADYGLAAQIGRGGGAGGMPQQQDPQNRMMQMMQLQQLQQNMMLAREQEARQQQLFGPQLKGKEAELATEGLRQNVLRNQGRKTNVEADAAEMDMNARRGVVQYLAANSANPRDPKTLAALAATNPLAHDELVRRFGETDAIRAKGAKEGALSLQAQNELAQSSISNMSWAVDAVQNEREFQTLRRSLVGLDPTAADYIPEKFDGPNGEAMRRLRLRLGAWKDTVIEEDEGGRKYITNKRTGGRRYLPPVESAPATAPTDAGIQRQMGILPAGAAPLDAATFDAGGAYGTPVAQAREAAPLVQPRPAAPEMTRKRRPNFSKHRLRKGPRKAWLAKGGGAARQKFSTLFPTLTSTSLYWPRLLAILSARAREFAVRLPASPRLVWKISASWKRLAVSSSRRFWAANWAAASQTPTSSLSAMAWPILAIRLSPPINGWRRSNNCVTT